MGQNLMSGKRPQAKLKIMAKLGENIYRTTKIYRMIEAKPNAKPKWNQFAANTGPEFQAWREWWRSPQSNRWKNLPGDTPKPPPPEE